MQSFENKFYLYIKMCPYMTRSNSKWNKSIKNYPDIFSDIPIKQLFVINQVPKRTFWGSTKLNIKWSIVYYFFIILLLFLHKL